MDTTQALGAAELFEFGPVLRPPHPAWTIQVVPREDPEDHADDMP